jgi:hypothetical protein
MVSRKLISDRSWMPGRQEVDTGQQEVDGGQELDIGQELDAGLEVNGGQEELDAGQAGA